jgi:hypothetical protein
MVTMEIRVIEPIPYALKTRLTLYRFQWVYLKKERERTFGCYSPPLSLDSPLLKGN